MGKLIADPFFLLMLALFLHHHIRLTALAPTGIRIKPSQAGKKKARLSGIILFAFVVTLQTTREPMCKWSEHT